MKLSTGQRTLIFRILISFFVVPPLVSSCGIKTADPMIYPVSDLTNRLNEFDINSIEFLEQVSSTSSGAGKITRIFQNFDTSMLYFITEDGLLVKWNLIASRKAGELDLGITDPEFTTIAKDDDLVLTPNAVIENDDPLSFFTLNPHTFDGFSVWDINTENRVFCIGFNCDPNEQSRFVLEMVGATIHPDGRWVISYSGNFPVVIDLEDDLSQSQVVLDPYNDQEMHISKVAFDPRGEQLFILFEEGLLHVHRFDNNDGTISTFFSEFGQGNGERERIDEFLIDPRNIYVATIISGELHLSKISDFGDISIASIPVNRNSLLSFDQTGSLLFVADGENIRIINVETGAVIHTVQVVGLTAIFVSLDNRALLWADHYGGIHVLGTE